MKTIDELYQEAQAVIARVKARADGLKTAYDELNEFVAPFGQRVVFQQILPKDQEETFFHVMSDKNFVCEIVRVVLASDNIQDAAIKLGAFALDHLPGASEAMRDERGQYGLTPEIIEAILDRRLRAFAGIHARNTAEQEIATETKVEAAHENGVNGQAQPVASVAEQQQTKVKTPGGKKFKPVDPMRKTKDVTNHSFGQKVEDHVFILLGALFRNAKPPVEFEFTGKHPGRTRGTVRAVFVKMAADRLHLAPNMIVYFFTLFSRLEEYGIAIVAKDAATGDFELTDRAARALRSNNPANIQAIASVYRSILIEPPGFPSGFESVEAARKLANATQISPSVHRAAEKLGVALNVVQQVSAASASTRPVSRQVPRLGQ